MDRKQSGKGAYERNYGIGTLHKGSTKVGSWKEKARVDSNGFVIAVKTNEEEDQGLKVLLGSKLKLD